MSPKTPKFVKYYQPDEPELKYGPCGKEYKEVIRDSFHCFYCKKEIDTKKF